MKDYYGGICLDLYKEIPKEYTKVLQIGKNVVIGSGTVLAGNGFGYEKNRDGQYIHRDHKHKLIINDNVSIHANCVLDRGRHRNTIIGAGTKIDSGVHIGHNVQTGQNCIIGSGTRVLGSVTIGNNSTIWSGCIINQGVRIGNNCVVGAGTYLRKDVKDNTQIFGNKVIYNSKDLN